MRLTLEPKCPRTGLATAREDPQGWDGRWSETLSCLWLQIFGVKRDSFLPNGQGDHGNLPRQGEARHLWPHPFRYQSLVKLQERTLPGGGMDRRTFEQILEIVIVIGVKPRTDTGFFDRSSCPCTYR